LNRQFLFVGIVGLSIVNGMISPFLPVAISITAVLMPEVFPRSPGWVLFFSSILISSGTLLLSGVPAALYERLWEGERVSNVPMIVWLAGAALLSLPALRQFGVA
jgi:hypothetical protein